MVLYIKFVCICISTIVLFSGCGKARNVDDRYIPKSSILKSTSKKPCIPKQKVGKVTFDCTMSAADYSTLADDLRYLKAMRFLGEKGQQLNRLINFGSDSASAVGDHLATQQTKTVHEWFESNIQFILDESFEDQTPLTRQINGRNVSNPLLRSYPTPPYGIVDVPGHGPVEVSSQSIGIMLVGSGLFHRDRLWNDGSWSRLTMTRILRLGTLLHEARHNEGHGFPHVRCARDEEDVFACDPCLNGPNALQAVFYEAALEAVGDQLNEREKEEITQNEIPLKRESVLGTAGICAI
jgi:hypothetical protein